MVKERMKQIDFLNDIREESRKRALEIESQIFAPFCSFKGGKSNSCGHVMSPIGQVLQRKL